MPLLFERKLHVSVSVGHYYSKHRELYGVIQNDCRCFNNLSYTIHLRWEYVVVPMDKEILKVVFYDLRCAVVINFSAWSAVY